ncbi:hypothetical protein [Chamaesiphon sp. VAR_48_metabat_403]|uniref:hypothetical protein n=1 Tax=Chamaesiphon sp. VAR_48_metabat_403 TaxID=2964700 RepID=UPI00286E6052|nr:hypothetical protein [Chamaesiphon sp. VAR_48_metabat_403]
MKFRSVMFSVCFLWLSIATQARSSIPIANNFSIKQRSISPSIPDGRLSIANDEFSLMRKERIGSLRIGLSEAKVKQIMNCNLKREPEQFSQADAAYHQEWKYADCGIVLVMASDLQNASKSVYSISTSSPSRLSTKRGIRIGSTRTAVMKAYKSEWNRGDGGSESFVAGSICGGLIFQFENGKVSQIFLGAAAE